jgi:hypothetical protein
MAKYSNGESCDSRYQPFEPLSLQKGSGPRVLPLGDVGWPSVLACDRRVRGVWRLKGPGWAGTQG